MKYNRALPVGFVLGDVGATEEYMSERMSPGGQAIRETARCTESNCVCFNLWKVSEDRANVSLQVNSSD
jgi:hypothetical protein